jgi:hypothetical protein
VVHERQPVVVVPAPVYAAPVYAAPVYAAPYYGPPAPPSLNFNFTVPLQ